MPSLRSRTSPLKFFASSTPKAESQQDSHQAWQKEYLNGLRSNRPARPSGARPPPNHMPGSNSSILETPLRTSSAMSFRPSLPMRQTSPTRLLEQERCSSALSHRQRTSYTSQSSVPADQSCQGNSLDLDGTGGAILGQAHPAEARIRDISSNPRISSGVYKEREQRLVEKEEARMLREALEIVDQQEEARLHSAAQFEASELVWKHQNPQESLQNTDAPYLYKHPLRRTAHIRSRSDAPVSTSTTRNEDQDWTKRSASVHSNHGGNKMSMSTSHAPDADKDVPRSETQTTEPSKLHDQTEDRPETSQIHTSQGHVLWDSPQKKAYMNLSFPLPQIRSSGRRWSSGSKTRAPSGSLFSNPDDKIYEEPEETVHETKKPKSEQAAEPVPLRSTIRNPIAKLTNQPHLRSRTDPVGRKDKHFRTEIYRNPPSQSRNPSYLQNELPSTAPNPPAEHDALITQSGIPDAPEIRSDDIRAATSMRLKDRSPKLLSPTFVSNAKGRPIVSFDRYWTPSKADSKRQESLPPRPTGRDHDCQPPATIRSKPFLPGSTASAPIIPIINVPEPPPIQIVEASYVPSTSESTIPTFSISEADTPYTSVAESAKPSRPLPAPKKSTPKPSGRPLPHHSSTAPVHTSLPHWSPSQRRATAQCAACGLPISGRIVSAVSQRFHPECFTCFHCSEQLECVAFYPEPDTFRSDRIARIEARADGMEIRDEVGRTWEDDGDESLRFYCHLDFHEKFSPRCRNCKTPIEGEVVVACGGEWHVGHFFCAQCGDPFDQETPFVEKDGYAWCVGCHTNRFSGKCRGCKKPVVDLVVRALGGEWHESCFCCKKNPTMYTDEVYLIQECDGSFEDGRFFTRGDEEMPVCVKCEEKRLKA
ncbi:MAG: hypothetical protein Q9166_000424 [cf. Caloplaca sp. 2 TL-2023]